MLAFVADPSFLSPSSLNLAQAQAVMSKIPSGHDSTAIVFSFDVKEIRRLIEHLQPSYVQLAAGASRIPLSSVKSLQSLRSKTKIIMAIGVNDSNPKTNSLRFEPFVDTVILDTNDPNRVDVGATGETHDWSISADIVSSLTIPVMLAGGLSADNIASAVQKVRPWAVDSFSLTNRDDDPIRKDIRKVTDFVTRAKNA